jgi:3-oxoacyl-[acyl-carrier-protein] synthase-1
MPAPQIVIASAGVVTPVGLSLAETAAAARARVARIREIGLRDRRYEPFLAGTVPADGLPGLDSSLAAKLLQPREDRMLQLAHAALDEALAPLHGKDLAPVPLLLGLPELHTTVPLHAKTFLAHLDLQCPGWLDIARSVAVPRGRAGGLMALREAGTRLARGDCPFMLIGGVDSLIDLYLLNKLDMEGRIRNEVNSDGFSPGEGAAFLLLALSTTAQEHGLTPLARVLGHAQGKEPGHIYSNEKYLGEGLSATFAALLSESPPPSPIGSVYCSFNGERYWAREFGVARLRHSEAFAPDQAMEHPAECFGDLGAAHGPALAAVAAHGVRYGYRAAPCLVYASSDHGDRAAALLAAI